MQTMSAVRLTRIGQALELETIPLPIPEGAEVLVQIRAAGICHSDVHFWAGDYPVSQLPITLGHEIAGVVEAVGPLVDQAWLGERVCLHYVVSCGQCQPCREGRDSLCAQAEILGMSRDGGYAQAILVPAANLVALPPEIPFEHGAVLMCSAATSYHALRRGRLQAGESVAVFGTGGVGMSAVQLARAFGASQVLAVDIKEDKLQLAQRYGATPINARLENPVAAIRNLTGGAGVDVALGVVGLPQTMQQAVQSVRPAGRAVLVGLSDRPFELHPTDDVILKEAEILGSIDHNRDELATVVDLARRGALDMEAVVQDTVPLDPTAITRTLVALAHFRSAVRTVILPNA
jgi:propanol-preferring alcohol dehydrogenase